MQILKRFRHRESGMTLIELMVVTTILGAVILVVTSFLTSSSRVETRTARRAGVQGDSRQALELIGTELRQAGADPHDPPTGAAGLIGGDSVMVHVKADLNADGVFSTTEPSEDVTYQYDAGAKTLTRNPGSGASVLLANVSAMSLSYYDASNLLVTPLPLSTADAARVHSVNLTLTCVNKDSQPLTLSSRVTLRNQ